MNLVFICKLHIWTFQIIYCFCLTEFVMKRRGTTEVSIVLII